MLAYAIVIISFLGMLALMLKFIKDDMNMDKLEKEIDEELSKELEYYNKK